ncbi:MAG: efflux transporter periplasmic adaptor subunit [Betaproteobacteria bacterium]|nr:efflux transporter periplasmic adaptor subunit [Betaproteobacteria bacterium]
MFASRTSKSVSPAVATSGAALLAALAGLAGCGGAKPAAPAAQPPEVSVVAVQRASVPVTTELPGRTSPYLVAQVRARVDGIVLRRDFGEGGDVKAGQRLYQIDPAPYRAALDSAIGALQKSQANLVAMNAQAERYKVLVQANAVSKQEYDNAVSTQGQAAADVAFGKAGVQTAKINLGYTDVVSPITGRTGLSLVTQGALVQASAATLLTTVQQIDPIYVDLNQSSVQGLQLRRDVASGKVKLKGPAEARVTLFMEDGTQYPRPGTLQFTDITVDQNTGSVTVRAIFPNPTYVLLPGMFVRARIEQGVNENALLVPQVGVSHDQQGQATALVVGADNKVALRTIQASRLVGTNWVVDAGLNQGEKVVVSGRQKAPPGTLVRAVETSAAPASQNATSPQQPASPQQPPSAQQQGSPQQPASAQPPQRTASARQIPATDSAGPVAQTATQAASSR